jgi:hypothetical protein
MICLGVVGDAERMAATPRQLDRQCMHAAQSPSAVAPQTSPCAAHAGDPVRIHTQSLFPGYEIARAGRPISCSEQSPRRLIPFRPAPLRLITRQRPASLSPPPPPHRKSQIATSHQTKQLPFAKRMYMHADADADGSHRAPRPLTGRR